MLRYPRSCFGTSADRQCCKVCNRGGGCGVLGLVYKGSCECSGLCQTVMVCFGCCAMSFPKISMEISRHLRYRLIHIWAAFPAELCCRGVGILIATVSLAACQPASFFSSKDLLKGIYNSLKAGCHSAGSTMGRTFAAGSSVTAVADICQSETGFVQVRFGQQGVESQGDANLLQHTGQMVVVKWKATADVPHTR